MIKKLLILLSIIGFAGVAFAAPSTVFQRTILPEADNAYDLGTTTLRWRNLYLSGTCTGCGGGVGTSTNPFMATYFVATSTVATSTFPNIDTSNINALTSAGFDFHSNNGTPVALFGAGGGANTTFYGGVNIDGTTRLATSLTGLLKATSGTVSVATPGTDYATFGYLFPNNATTTGLMLLASTTIGAGTQTTGLTVSGGATTTGNMYVAGSVGIGTASPSSPLSIQSATGDKVSVRSTTGNNELRVYMDDVTANGVQLYTVGASSLGFSTNSTGNKLAIDANGMVAIGSTVVTNTGKLHVAGASGIVQTGAGTVGSGTGIVYNRFSSTGSDFYYGIENSAGGGLFVGGLPYAGMFGTANATAFQIATNNNTRLTIGSNGNVGIGTTTPWGKLSVTNTGTAPSFVVEDTTSPDSTPFIVDASGNVGIGKTNPAYSIDSAGRIHAEGGFSTLIGGSGIGLGTTPSGAYQTIVSAGDIVLEAANGAEVVVNEDGSSSDFRVEGDTITDLFFVDASADKVGIGTTTPTSLFQAFSTATTTISVDSNHASRGSCLELKDSDGVGYTYVTANNGVLTASTISCK